MAENTTIKSKNMEQLCGDSFRYFESILPEPQCLNHEDQIRSCINNLNIKLNEAGGSLQNLVEVTAELSSMEVYDQYNGIYAEFFQPNGPARTTVAHKDKMQKNNCICISAIAYIIKDAGETSV